MNSNFSSPVNIGSQFEFTIKELAELVRLKTNPNLDFIFKPLPSDDPLQRKPILDLAKKELLWEPFTQLDKGLDSTISWFKKTINNK